VVGSLDLVRALGLAGINSAVMAPPGDFARFSRHTRATIDAVDAATEPEELVARLLVFAGAQPTPPVLFYDGDFKLLALSRARAAIRAAFRVVLPPEDLTEDLIDKARFADLVERADLPVPPSVRVAPNGDAPALGLRYPLVIKPLTRRNEVWGPLTSGKAIAVETPDDLRALWPRLVQAGGEVLAQEQIPGPETLVESYHAYVDDDGDLVAEFTGRKIRTYPTRYGYSTALEITAQPDVVEAGRDILERIAFRGVAKLDFKRHATERRLYLLEVNPRFNIWHHPAAKAGVNLMELVYCDLLELPRPPTPAARPGARWVHPWFDLRAARAQNVPLARWIPWMLDCEAKYGFALDDPLPIPRVAARRVLRRVRGMRRPFESR
jgi:predicted ATP-grasp superfamily ATP-dependent carboligase